MRAPSTPPPDLHPQAAEMFVWMAAHAVEHIGTGSAEYLDFTVPVAGLALSSCLVACERSGYTPDFSRPRRPDPWVHSEFGRQLMAELNREQHARVQQGVWRCWYDPQADVAHQRLTRRRRLSALMLLDARAKAALLQTITGKPLAGLSPDELYHAMAASVEMLHFLTHTDAAHQGNSDIPPHQESASRAVVAWALQAGIHRAVPRNRGGRCTRNR